MNAPPTLLAFDTSTEQLAVAVLWPGGMLTDNSPGGAAASAQLLPRIQALLAHAGLPLQALDAIAFGAGPGAFTGLRTSCAVAQGLAYGLARPVLPIDSLLIVAEDARVQAGAGSQQPPEDFEIAVAVDARMDEAYAAQYRHGAEGWQTVRAPALLGRAALAAAWPADAAPARRAGSAWFAQGETDRAGALGRLALAAWFSGKACDPALAVPIYLRDRVALTTQERQAVKDDAARAKAT